MNNCSSGRKTDFSVPPPVHFDFHLLFSFHNEIPLFPFSLSAERYIFIFQLWTPFWLHLLLPQGLRCMPAEQVSTTFAGLVPTTLLDLSDLKLQHKLDKLLFNLLQIITVNSSVNTGNFTGGFVILKTSKKGINGI